MNLTTLTKQVSTALMAVAAVGLLTLAPVASAIPYTPEHTGTSSPAFNVFTGVPQEGDESDFLRGKEEGNTAASVNHVQSACNNGQRFTLRVYVHNSANQTLNESGVGIARGTKVKVDLPDPAAQSANFPINGTISATNASTVNDDMAITCANGKKVKMSYVPGTAKQFTGYSGTKALSDTIVTTGAPVGTEKPDGNVLGCFAQRVYVTLTVKVVEVPTTPPPVTPPPVTPPPTTPPPVTPPTTPPVTPPAPKPEQPTTLPVTGPVGIGLLATAVSGASSLGYYLLNGRRRF